MSVINNEENIKSKKIKIYQGDGRTREEKECCFPCAKEQVKNEIKGAGI